MMALFHSDVLLSHDSEHACTTNLFNDILFDVSGKAQVHLITLIKGPVIMHSTVIVNVMNYTCAFPAIACQNVCWDTFLSTN